MECYETCVDIGKHSKVYNQRGSCTECGTYRSCPCCDYQENNATLNDQEEKDVDEDEELFLCQTLKNSHEGKSTDDNNNKTAPKQTCWQWFKSLFGFGKPDAKKVSVAPKKSGQASGQVSGHVSRQISGQRTSQSQLSSKSSEPISSKPASVKDVNKETPAEPNQIKYSRSPCDRLLGNNEQDNGVGDYRSRYSQRQKKNSKGATSRKSSPNSKSPISEQSRSWCQSRSRSKSNSRSRSRSPSRSPGNRVSRRLSNQPRSTWSSVSSNMCSLPLCCSVCQRKPSISLTSLLSRNSKRSPSCPPKCKCCSPKKPCGSPRRCPCPKSSCCCPSRSRPRSCPKPSRCSCIPCSPCPPSSLSKPCVPKPKCIPCCKSCSSAPCCPGNCCCCCKPLRCCKPFCNVCPKISQPTPCCQPKICCPPRISYPPRNVQASSCCPSGLSSKYDRSKSGDALCKMLLAKYSKPKTLPNFSSRSSVGGCRACPTPGECDGSMPVPGNNRTNSRHSCSPERKKKPKNCPISYTSGPNEKKPYKEVDLSSAIYTPCVKRTGPRSPVQHFFALKRAECPVANMNNGALTDDVDCYDLDNLRVRFEAHYQKNSRLDQARAFHKCEHVFNKLSYTPLSDGANLYDIDATHSASMSSLCRNNNFGDENFRFFRNYLNITPATQIQGEEHEVINHPGQEVIDRSRNTETFRDDIIVTPTSSSESDNVEARISRLDKWILGGGPPGDLPAKIKSKSLVRKKSGPVIGAQGGTRKKPIIRTGKRKIGTLNNRVINSNIESGTAARLLAIQKDLQTDLVKFTSPQRGGDQLIHHTEIKMNMPSTLESQFTKETASEVEYKTHLPESRLGSPRKMSTDQMQFCEREEYTPEFKREAVNEQQLTSPPKVITEYAATPANNVRDNTTEHTPIKKTKSESVASKDGTNPTKRSDPRFSSRNRIPLRNSSRDRRPKSKDSKFLSPPLASGESCVDGSSVISPTPEPSPCVNSETLQLKPEPRQTFLSKIASIWGPRARHTTRSESHLITSGMSSDHILSGKESSVDLPGELRKQVDGSSNNDYDESHKSTVTHHIAISELDENESELYEDIDFDINAHSSRESLVEMNRSRNRGGTGSEVNLYEDIYFDINAHSSRESLVEVNKSNNSGGMSNEINLVNVPSSADQVNADQIISPISTMTGTITTSFANPSSGSCTCTDTCVSSLVSSSAVPHNVSGGPNSLTSKIASMNLTQLLGSCNVRWQRIGEDDIDVASIRRAKEEFMKQHQRKKAAAAVNADPKDKTSENASSVTPVVSTNPDVPAIKTSSKNPDVPATKPSSKNPDVFQSLDEECDDDSTDFGSTGALCIK